MKAGQYQRGYTLKSQAKVRRGEGEPITPASYYRYRDQGHDLTAKNSLNQTGRGSIYPKIKSRNSSNKMNSQSRNNSRGGFSRKAKPKKPSRREERPSRLRESPSKSSRVGGFTTENNTKESLSVLREQSRSVISTSRQNQSRIFGMESRVRRAPNKVKVTKPKAAKTIIISGGKSVSKKEFIYLLKFFDKLSQGKKSITLSCKNQKNVFNGFFENF